MIGNVIQTNSLAGVSITSSVSQTILSIQSDNYCDFKQIIYFT